MHALIRASGAIAAGGPLMALVGGAYLEGGWRLDRLDPVGDWPAWTLLTASALVAVGGAAIPHRRNVGRNLIIAGVGAFLVQATLPALTAPALALAALSATAVLVHLLWPVAEWTDHHDDAPVRSGVARARGAAAMALLGWSLVGLGGRELDLGVFVPHFASLVVAGLLGLAANLEPLGQSTAVRVATWISAALSLVAVGLFWGSWLPCLVGASLLPTVTLVVMAPPPSQRRFLPAVIDFVASQPARLLATTFVLLCVLGAALLRLPVASASGHAIAWIDAAFTATSAVCVTGLIVLDTPNDFSVAGQVMLLVMIQLGGLGIMSFSTAAFAALGRRLSLKHEAAIADLVSGGRAELFVSLRRLLIVTLATEIGAGLLLTALFTRHGDSTGMALWRGMFTSISAFCNAGFALQSNSLVPYQSDPWIIHVVSLVIIIGGLSPAVVIEAPRWLRGGRASVQTKLVVVVNLALLVGAAFIVGGLEWSHAFGHLSFVDRAHAAWFQSVTLRTAGFNSVDFAALRPATTWSMLAFMFIGGSPGGTAGGIKTTTVAVLLLAVGSAMRGRWSAAAFGRRLTHRTVYEAAAIATIAGLFVFFGVIAVAVTQAIPLTHIIFEVVSALGTVGISVGATGQLDDVGKIMIMLFMFIGRIGPLTLFLFLRERLSDAPWELPETNLDVG